MKGAAKIILILVAIVAVDFIAFVLLAFRTTPMESAKHLAHVDWLPAEASDVTYAKREGFGWFTCYECSLPREAFDQFARKEGWQMTPKSDVSTGLRGVLDLPATKHKAEPNGVVTVDLNNAQSMPVVKKALFYEDRHQNGGGVTVIYDLDAGRLFVHESHN